MVLTIIESEQSGIALTDTFIENITTLFNPESIRIHTKNFSLSLLSDMMDRGYIRATPDFHRNMVWNTVQKSRLIESILLRIPLPMFYFSEDDEGFITIIDGMQRLTTIKEFMDNKFPLSHLEYLSICEGKYYSSSKNGSTNEKPVIETKYLRVFNTTQITANVIDPSSPPNVKYDIFKRVNTGGKTLNSQEIRWYLASSALRITLQKMTESDTFKWATGNSIRSTRMEDRAIALRFISFYNYYTKDKTLENYNGNMEMTLDDAAELFSKSKAAELGKYVHLFDNSMKNAAHLFGNTYAFRKVLPTWSMV